MPRTARLTFPGGFYHLFNRSLVHISLFPDTQYYEKLLEKLSLLAKEGDWIIYAYCLMPNHYHLLVEEKNTPIAKLMGRLFTSYSTFFNKRNKRHGPLFEDRYKSKLVQKDNYFLEVSRYIHLNPVKSGLVANPQDYEYSSLKEYLGYKQRKIINQDKVTALLLGSKKKIADYLKFLKEGIKLNLDEYNPFLTQDDTLGSPAFSTHRKIV